MAMRQWDGGPRHVKGEQGGGGLLGGMLSGYFSGSAALSLEEFKNEQQMEREERAQANRVALEQMRQDYERTEKKSERVWQKSNAWHAEQRGRADKRATMEHEKELLQMELDAGKHANKGSSRTGTSAKDLISEAEREVSSRLGVKASEIGVELSDMGRSDVYDSIRDLKNLLRRIPDPDDRLDAYEEGMAAILAMLDSDPTEIREPDRSGPTGQMGRGNMRIVGRRPVE